MQLLVRFITYGAVGAVISLLYSAAVVLFVDGLGFRSAVAASGLAFALTLPLSFLAHKHVTFRHAPFDPRQPGRFALMAVSSFLMAVIGMYVITDLLRLSYLFGILLTWVLIPSVNFVVGQLWIFRDGPRLPRTSRPQWTKPMKP